MYSINVDLLKRLSKSLGLSQREFSEQTFGRQQTWPQRMTFFDRLLLTDLVTISNRWHIPIRWFLDHDGATAGVPRIEQMVHQGEWQEVYIDTEAFRTLYSGHGKSYSRGTVQQALDVTGSCIWRWITVKFTMRAQTACDFCNFTQTEVTDFVIDRNWNDPSAAAETADAAASEGCADENACCGQDRCNQLQAENAALRSDVEGLHGSFNALRAAVQTLAEGAAFNDASVLAVLKATDFAGNTSKLSPYRWNAGKWGTDAVPTLAEVLARCNAEQRSTAEYLLTDMAALVLRRQDLRCPDADFQTIEIDREAFACVRKAFGMTDAAPETLSIQSFCDAINLLHLTPRCCLRDAQAGYPRLFADELVQQVKG